jgi:hypothetical protein
MKSMIAAGEKLEAVKNAVLEAGAELVNVASVAGRHDFAEKGATSGQGSASADKPAEDGKPEADREMTASELKALQEKANKPGASGAVSDKKMTDKG